MKRLILHIGMHKTGSSSIQAAFHGFQNETARYAKIGKSANHGIALRAVFEPKTDDLRVFKNKGQDDKTVQGRIAHYDKRLDAELHSDTETLIMSGEGASRFDGAMVATFLDRVRNADRDVQVIGYARDPIDFARTSFQQRIKSLDTEVFLKAQPDYRDRFGPWKEALPDGALTVRAFDPAAFPGGSVVKDFAQFCGLDPALFPDKRENTSMTFAAASLIWRMNMALPEIHGRPDFWRARKRVLEVIGTHATGRRFDAPLAYYSADEDLQAQVDWLFEATGVDYREALKATLPKIKGLSLREYFFLPEVEDEIEPALDTCLAARQLRVGDYDRIDKKLMMLLLDCLSEEAGAMALENLPPAPAPPPPTLGQRLKRRFKP